MGSDVRVGWISRIRSYRRSPAVVMVAIAAIALSACAKAGSEEASRVEPAKVVKVKGSNQTRVVLTKKAADRLGVTTGVVREVAGPKGTAPRKAVDYSAIIYDAEGNAFVFTNPAPLTFERVAVRIDVIEGNTAYLSDGPAPGTVVATVGVPELYGIDAGVGGNE